VDDQDAGARGRKKLDGPPYIARLTEIGTVYLMHSKCVTYLQREKESESSSLVENSGASRVVKYYWPTGKFTTCTISRICSGLLANFNQFFETIDYPFLKFHKHHPIRFLDILLTHIRTIKQTNGGENSISPQKLPR